MEEAFIRAELFIKAIKNISPGSRSTDVKAYADALEKEFKIIKKEVERYAPKPKEPQFFGPHKAENKWNRMPSPVPAPEVSSDQQAEKK